MLLAIDDVNYSHHWKSHHKINKTTIWVEQTKEERAKELREIIINGFEPQPPTVSRRWDTNAFKWRTISEPVQWPDQYIHHALIQVLQPIMMRNMDMYCCGSIPGRGTAYARKNIEHWVRTDLKGTKYGFSGDIRHFYDSLQPKVVMDRMHSMIKDGKTLDLIERTIKNGILIGAYPSQWFANTTLQPLDRLIRNSGLCKYYVRYMDNITIFGSNKRNLHKLKRAIEQWLNAHQLQLKYNWQIYKIAKKEVKEKLSEPRNGVSRPKGRLPDAVGYRYGRTYTLPRKRNLLKIKRGVDDFFQKRAAGQELSPKAAAGLISRLGQLQCCNNYNFYQRLFRGHRVLSDLKKVIKKQQRKERETWNIYLE